MLVTFFFVITYLLDRGEKMAREYMYDLTDIEWNRIEPFLKEGVYRGAGTRGKYSRREMLNAILHVLKTGCRWSDLPPSFPPWKSVYSQFLRWRERGIFEKIQTLLKKQTKLSSMTLASFSTKNSEERNFEKVRVSQELETYCLITLDA